MNISVPGSDAALLNAIRSGDAGAYDVLRVRHAAAAARLASHLPRGSASAEDIVGWAFAQVLDAIRRGGGPTDAFRPYLLTAVRRAARDCAAGRATPVPMDAQDIPDPGQLAVSPPDRGAAGGGPGGSEAAVTRAFLSLPERWRAVLWHTEIEGVAPAAVATLFGLSEAEADDLAASAREGLARTADLSAPGDGPARAGAAEGGSGDAKGDEAAGGAGGRAEAGVAYVAGALRSYVAPLVLGQATEAYLTDAAPGAPVSPEPASPDAVSPVADEVHAATPVADGAFADGAFADGAFAASPVAADLVADDPDLADAGPGSPGEPQAADLPSVDDTIIPVAGAAGLAAIIGAEPAGAGDPRAADTNPDLPRHRPSAVGSAAMGGVAAAAARAQDSADSWPAGDLSAVGHRPRHPGERARAGGRAGAGRDGIGLASAGMAGAGAAAVRARAGALALTAAAGAQARELSGRLRDSTPRQRSLLAAGAVLLVVAVIVGYALTLSPDGGQATAAARRPVAAPGPRKPVSSAPAPPSSSAAAPKPKPKPPPPPAPVPAVPAVAPAPPPPAPARLTAQVSVLGPVGFTRIAAVNFSVNDVGRAGTPADVTVTIALPGGVSMLPNSGRIGGWSCSPTSPGAVCVHTPLAAGTGSVDFFSVLLDPATACNLSVQLSASAGGGSDAFASARIPCDRSTQKAAG